MPYHSPSFNPYHSTNRKHPNIHGHPLNSQNPINPLNSHNPLNPHNPINQLNPHNPGEHDSYSQGYFQSPNMLGRVANQRLSSLDSHNNPSSNDYYNNLDHQKLPLNPTENYPNPNSDLGFNRPEPAPLNDHPIDIQGLGNYPDEWMHAMPEPGHYVEIPVNNQSIGLTENPQFVESPLIGHQPNNLGPMTPIYQEMLPMDQMPMEFAPESNLVMPGMGAEVQTVHSMAPGMFVEQFQDDHLYLNLEEEYLQKVSMQNKPPNAGPDNPNQRN